MDGIFEKLEQKHRKSEDFETDQNSEDGYEMENEDYYNEMMREMEGENNYLYNEQINKQYEQDMQKYMMEQTSERDEEWMTEPD